MIFTAHTLPPKGAFMHLPGHYSKDYKLCFSVSCFAMTFIGKSFPKQAVKEKPFPWFTELP